MRRIVGLIVLLLVVVLAVIALVALWADSDVAPGAPAGTAMHEQDALTPPSRERKTRRSNVEGESTIPNVATDSAEAATELAPDDPQARVLAVVDEQSQPLVGVPYGVKDAEPQSSDLRGECRFAAPEDGLGAEAITVESPIGPAVVLDAPRTTVLLTKLVPVFARAVDLDTGQALAVLWTTAPEPVTEHRVGWARAGTRVVVDLRTRAVPGGYCGPAKIHQDGGALLASAQFAVLTVPFVRESELSVRVEQADGQPAHGAVVRRRPFPFVTEPAAAPDAAHLMHSIGLGTTGKDGMIPASFVPVVRGERVSVSALLRAQPAEPSEGGIALWYNGETEIPVRDTSDALELLVRLGPDATGFPDMDIHIGGGAGGAFGGRRASHGPVPVGVIGVQALDRNGRPVAHTKLALLGPRSSRQATTDSDGFARWERLAPGDYTVRLAQRGYALSTVDVVVAMGDVQEVVLREAEGRSISVQVNDADGRFLPGAELRVYSSATGWEYVHTDLGAQHLNLVTDATGRCRLSRLPDEGASVRVTYGSREVTVQLGPGATLEVTVPDAQ